MLVITSKGAVFWQGEDFCSKCVIKVENGNFNKEKLTFLSNTFCVASDIIQLDRFYFAVKVVYEVHKQSWCMWHKETCMSGLKITFKVTTWFTHSAWEEIVHNSVKHVQYILREKTPIFRSLYKLQFPSSRSHHCPYL